MEGNIQRRFIIGDEWLYFKIYSGPKTLESILVNELYEFISSLFESQLIDNFFFIRFTDPEYHLRLRFRIPDISNLCKVIHGFNQKMKPFIDNRLVWKVCLDTYNRELERYGKETIQLVENLFFYDSIAVLNFLKKTTENVDENIRWQWGIKFVDMLMSSFGMNLSEKSEFCKLTVTGFSEEFNLTKSLKIELDQKYRVESKKIKGILDSDAVEVGIVVDNLISEYVVNASSLIKDILNSEEYKGIEKRKFELLSSIIHMYLNRLFRTKQRLQEFVIYYLLQKYYSSRVSQLKYNQLNNVKNSH